MIHVSDKAMFHIHTARCKHATGTDREYIEKAISLGADEIWFTDHAPYPGDKIGTRMLFSEREEYVSTMNALRKEYAGDIMLKLGMEMEYFPSYEEYIRETRNSGIFDLLILGQHYYEREDGTFYFAKKNEENSDERYGLSEGMIRGIKTGLFDVVAHPDRIFRNCREWTEDMAAISQKIIDAAKGTDIYLEKNYASSLKRDHYWDELWRMVPPEVKTLKGLDAHSVDSLRFLDFDYTPVH